MYGVALVEASMGLNSSTERADTLETEPLHAVNALQVRMVYELWLGNTAKADEIRERVELRRIESGARQMADGSHLLWQAVAHAYSDDVMRLNHVIDDMKMLAQRHVAGCAIVFIIQRGDGDRGHVTCLQVYALRLGVCSAISQGRSVGKWAGLVVSCPVMQVPQFGISAVRANRREGCAVLQPRFRKWVGARFEQGVSQPMVVAPRVGEDRRSQLIRAVLNRRGRVAECGRGSAFPRNLRDPADKLSETRLTI